jgi:hypothetical protein
LILKRSKLDHSEFRRVSRCTFQFMSRRTWMEDITLPPWKWTYGEWKAVVVRIYMLQKWNAQTFLRKAKFHTKKEAKWASKPQKSKIFRLPFLISQQKRLFDQSSFTIQMSLGFFKAKFPMEMKAAKFCFDVYFAYFRYEILYAKYVDLLDKLKEVKNSQFFSTV